MNTTTILSIMSALGVAATGLWTLYSNIRDRDREVRKQETGVKLNEAQYTQIAPQAAALNSADMRKVGEFGQARFDAVVEQVHDQPLWINKAKRRWALHERWDDHVA